MGQLRVWPGCVGSRISLPSCALSLQGDLGKGLRAGSPQTIATGSCPTRLLHRAPALAVSPVSAKLRGTPAVAHRIGRNTIY